MDYIPGILHELTRQIPKFYFIYIVVFLALAINTILIYSASVNKRKLTAVLLIIENFFLTLTLLVGCVINVLMMDIAGYEVFNSTNNNLLIIFFMCSFLCIVDLIIILSHVIMRKIKNGNRG